MKFVKVYTKANINTTAALAHRIWSQHYESIIGSAQTEYMLDKFQSAGAIGEQIKAGARYYLLCCSEAPAGYLAIVPDFDDRSMFLSKLYIDGRYRSRGLGRASMEFITDMCRRMKLEYLWLTVNKDNRDSIRIYQKLGFRIEGSVKADIGNGFVMDDFKMMMPIKKD
jgi:diamine N-acetyltransferase